MRFQIKMLVWRGAYRKLSRCSKQFLRLLTSTLFGSNVENHSKQHTYSCQNHGQYLEKHEIMI